MKTGNSDGAVIKTAPQKSAKSMSVNDLIDHRSKIAFDVEVILQGYWDKQPPAEVKAGILADWADALEDWTQEQVLYALRQWRNEHPNKTPNPGHILSVLRELRAKAEWKRAPKVQIAPEPERELLSAERRAQIAAEMGLPDLTEYCKQFGERS